MPTLAQFIKDHYFRAMAYGICLLSIVPCRKEPSSTSEMVTQLLFGETYQVIEVKEEWIKIISTADRYESWISVKQHQHISEQLFKQIKNEIPYYTVELVQVLEDQQNNRRFPITLGARLPLFKQGKMALDQKVFVIDGNAVSPSKKNKAGDIIATSFTLLNAPYLWGGRSPFGIDCSGFVQLVYKLNGYELPRDASQQVNSGHPLSFVEEADAGDLAFFDNEEGKIVHVGIVLNQQQIIHASGCVRIDSYDHYGIFNKEIGKYSHHLRVIKRLQD